MNYTRRIAFLILTGLACINFSLAAPLVDNNAGTWVDSYNDAVGIVTASSTNYLVNASAGTLSLAAGQTNGYILSSQVSPSSYESWQSICINGSYASTNDIVIDLVNAADTNTIAGFTSLKLSPGGCIDISALDISNSTFRMKVSLNKTGAVAPVINDLTVQWTPITEILLDKSAPATINAGDQTLVYRLRYSVNYVSARDLVVWDTLPTNAGPLVVYPADFGQNDEPLPKGSNILQNATTGAQWWNGPAPLSFKGATIPAGSVYWDLGTVPEGTTRILQYTMGSPNGTLSNTLYKNTVYANATNGNPVSSLTVTTAVSSTANPYIDKTSWTLRSGSGVSSVLGTNYVLGDSRVTFKIRVGNDCVDSGCERMYNTVVYDDLSQLTGRLVQAYGTAGISNISSGGYYNPAYTAVVGSVTSVIPAIVWTNIGTVEPQDMDLFSSGRVLTYSVQFTNTQEFVDHFYTLTNVAVITSVRTQPVSTNMPLRVVNVFPPPGGPGWTKWIVGCNPAVPCSRNWGDIVEFSMGGRNGQQATFKDIIIVDKVPSNTTFISATASLGTGGQVFYATTTDFSNPTNPPPTTWSNAPGDLDLTGNDYWSTTLPSLTSVTWAAWYWPNMSSVQDPDPAYASQVKALMKVRISAPSGGSCCVSATVTNYGNFAIHRYSAIGDPAVITNWDGQIKSWVTSRKLYVEPDQGSFLGASDSLSQPVVSIPGTSTYSVVIINDGIDSFTNVTARIFWSPVQVQDTWVYPSFAGVSGGTILEFTPTNGTILLKLGAMPIGSSNAVHLTLQFPAGASDQQAYTVSSELTGYDNCCPPVTRNLSEQGRLASFPDLRVVKESVLEVILSGSELEYRLTASNIGNTPSRNTYVVDHVPQNMVFKRAFGPAGESVYVSDKTPPDLPSSLNLLDPITKARIAAQFVLATVNTNGTTDPSDDVWTSPYGESTTWVAWKIDSTSNNQFAAGASASFGFVALNDTNINPAVTNGSPEGTTIYNDVGILSDENLQALGNTVDTTIGNAPSLKLNKYSPAGGFVAAGAPFDWIIDFYNNSGVAQSAVLTDTLPIELTYLSATMVWNSVATNNGLLNPIAGPIPTSVSTNLDGRVVLTFNIAGDAGLTNELKSLEGGTITIRVQATNGTPAGTTIQNCAIGMATNTFGSSQATDCDAVEVQTCDLSISKSVDNVRPAVGEEVSYTIRLSNEGSLAATNVVLTDVLPSGLVYVTNSFLILTPGWGMGQPQFDGRTSIWNMAAGNTISNTAAGQLGYVPGHSGNIFFMYRAAVTSGVPGVAMTNVISVTTPVPETNYLNNSDAEAVTPPLADLAVTKTSDALANPGETLDYTISYWNDETYTATNVYLIDTLPDRDSNGTSDVTFVTTFANGPGTVDVWYHTNQISPVPVFDPASPASTGWTNSPLGLLVNHLAYNVGTMAPQAGPYAISVTVRLTDPATGANINDGILLTNHVQVASGGVERTLTNNTASAVTRTPGVDMALTKTGNPEGSFPGTAPGHSLTYTLSYENSGSVRAYGIYVIDTLPAEVTASGTPDNFSAVVLEDELGEPVNPVDTNGAAILVSVPVTRTVAGQTITWYLGSLDSGDPLYYRNIGIPVGAGGSFQVFTTLRADIADSTVVVNPAVLVVTNQVGNDVAEAYTNNNWDSAQVSVYRADVAVEKTVVDVPTGSSELTDSGNALQYTVNYDNLGNLNAENTIITEYIPVGTRFVPNSITGLPGGAVVSYTPDNTTNATRFEVELGTLPAPATYDSESTTNDFTGTTDETVVTTNGTVQLNNVAASSGTNFNMLIDFGSSVYMTTNGASAAPYGGFGWNNFTNPAAGSVLSNLVTYTPGFAGVTTTVAIILNTAATIDTNGLGGTGPGRFRPRATIDSFSGTGSGSITMTLTNLDPNLNYMLEVYGSRLTNGLAAGLNGETEYVVSGAEGSASTRVNVYSNLSPVARGVISAMKPFNNGTLTLTLSKTINNTIDFYCLSALEIVACAAPLQFHENFDYPAVANASYSTNIAWRTDGTSAVGGTNLTGSLSYTGLAASVGNRMNLNPTILANANSRMWREINYKFDANNALYGSNSPYYCSFLFKVTDIGTLAYTNHRGFVWMEGGGANDGFIIRLNTNNPANYDVGIANTCQGTGAPVAPVWNMNGGNGYAPGQTLFVVMGMTNASQSLLFDLWINPSSSTFGLAAPSSDLSTTNKRAVIKGDSIAIGSGNGASIELDELRIGPSYADVTPPAGSNPTNGTYTTYIQSSGTLLTWDRLLVTEEEGSGTTLRYTLLDQTGATVLLGPTNATSIVDLSGIPNTYTQLMLRVEFDSEFSGSSPVLDDWTATYRTTERPSFTFRVTVNNPLSSGQAIISNYIQIATTTPESNYANNDDDVEIGVRTTDLEIQKAVSTTSTMEGSNLVYTITYRNNGPLDGTNVVIRDVFPADYLSYLGSTPVPTEINTGMIGINLGTNAAPADWNVLYSTVRTNDNLVATDGNGSGISAGWSGSLTDNGVTPVASTVPTGIDRQIFSNCVRQTAARTLTFTNLDANVQYGFWIVGLSNQGYTNNVELRGASTNLIVQASTGGANRVWMNGIEGSSNNSFFSYAPSLLFPRADGTIDLVVSVRWGFGAIVIERTPAELEWTFPVLTNGASGTLSVTGQVRVGAAGNTLNNYVTIANDRQETTYDNNADDVSTYVGVLANVYITKTGPNEVSLGRTNTFILSYGNNGSGIAPEVIVQDILPQHILFADSTPATNASPALSWNLGTLQPGTSGVITISFVVTNPAAAYHWITNWASISTTTNESSITDNQDDHPVYPVIDPARISGMVWLDENINTTNEVFESGISNITVVLTGVDIFGSSITQETVTASDGTYSFPGLNPGTYVLREVHVGDMYISTASVRGTGAEGSGNIRETTSPHFNIITNIVLNSGSVGIDFDFGDRVKPFLAVIGDVSAFTRDGQTIVQWETVATWGTLGFYLERFIDGEWVRINTELLEVDPFNPPPQIYQQVDAGTAAGNTYLWRLVELDIYNQELIYGPYALTVNGPGRTYDDWSAGIDWGDDSSARDADPDGDGLTNWQEFLAGTDPLDADSVLRIIDLKKVETGIEISWLSVPGRQYRLAVADEAGGPYLPLERVIQAVGDRIDLILELPAGDGPQFFRVIMVGGE